MIKKNLLTLIFACGIILTGKVSAQTATDSAGINHVIAGYYTAIGKQSHLYNGPEYEFYPPYIKGNAYVFDVSAFGPGRVKYDRTDYSNVPMLYDLNKDALVILLYNNFTKISLLSERVTDFSLLGHYFVRIKADSLAGAKKVPTGFYDQLFAGRHVTLFAKRSKSIQTTTGNTSLETFFAATEDYYLKRGDEYFRFSGKSSLLSLFKDRKKELNRFIKTNHIDYRNNPETSMIAIVKHYDELEN
ncbi:hypothetical protein LX99_04557 [Mucilaginibacter oryzae]|uniref:DKNYY family protein n=1 Tax=Mucilaginibacter oryzae TaxID=468058 RepID=A0A316GZT7_9SPHI|nr:hypothetical protein [Mucilaginibacter oryzae]PWK70849.1 hypothetical protein LX99_04557 [Mucilaginibacter oryzae]